MSFQIAVGAGEVHGVASVEHHVVGEIVGGSCADASLHGVSEFLNVEIERIHTIDADFAKHVEANLRTSLHAEFW